VDAVILNKAGCERAVLHKAGVVRAGAVARLEVVGQWGLAVRLVTVVVLEAVALKGGGRDGATVLWLGGKQSPGALLVGILLSSAVGELVAW
jgi:hypothetical protein